MRARQFIEDLVVLPNFSSGVLFLLSSVDWLGPPKSCLSMLESSWLGFRQAQWLSFEEVHEGIHLAKFLASPLMKPLLISLFTQSTIIAQLNAQALSRIIVLAALNALGAVITARESKKALDEDSVGVCPLRYVESDTTEVDWIIWNSCNANPVSLL